MSNVQAPDRIEFRLLSSRLGGAALQFLTLSLLSWLCIGLFWLLSNRLDSLWLAGFSASLMTLWPVANSAKRVLMMLFEWPALVIDENEIVDRRGVRSRRWSLSDVEVLSPEISSVWNKTEALQLTEVALDIEGFLLLSLRKKKDRTLYCVFSDYIEAPLDAVECDSIRHFMGGLVTRYGFKNELLVEEAEPPLGAELPLF